MYKNKEIAIKHLKDGKSFSLNIFNNFRDDKEVALAAVSQYVGALSYASPKIQELCKDKDPIKTLGSVILHEQLQKEIKPKGLDFAKALSAECKQAAMEQSKPKARMKI